MNQRTVAELLDLLEADGFRTQVACVVMLVALVVCLVLRTEAEAVARAARDAGKCPTCGCARTSAAVLRPESTLAPCRDVRVETCGRRPRIGGASARVSA